MLAAVAVGRSRISGALEGEAHQVEVPEQAVGVFEFGAAVKGGLADRELVLVHQADDGVGVRDFLDLAADLARPALQLDPLVGLMVGGGQVLQAGVEFAVAGIDDDDRAIGRRSFPIFCIRRASRALM